MAENFQNFYVTKLREACDASATTIYVETIPTITEGTLVIEYASSTKHEIIHFTGRSGYSLTGCTRGYEGTTAQSHSAGVDVRQNVTAGILDKITNRAITTENIADEAVTTAKIDDGAVTSDKIDFTTLGFVDSGTRDCGYAPTSETLIGQSVTIGKGKWLVILSGISDFGTAKKAISVRVRAGSISGTEVCWISHWSESGGDDVSMSTVGVYEATGETALVGTFTAGTSSSVSWSHSRIVAVRVG